MTSHIEPLAAQARPVRTRQHRIKHDTRMLDRPQRPVGAVKLTADLGFMPATTDEADIERHRRHNKNADYWLALPVTLCTHAACSY